MADDLIISYANDILVRPRHNQEVRVTLTKQGPQGPQGEKGDTGDITAEAKAALIAGQTAVANAKTSETNSKASENAAKASQTAASTSEANAKTAETNAKSSATAASTAKTAAETARDDALSSKTSAASSASAAKTSETNAKTSETNSKASETSASASASSADASQRTASASETAAQESQDAAAASAAAALASKNAAKTSETNAKASEESAFNSKSAASASNNEAQNAKTAAEAAQVITETARDSAQDASNAARAAQTQAETARDASQTAETNAAASAADATLSKNAAADYAAAAAASAEEANKFDPSTYPTKANNGSDFADPNQVRVNIGAALAIDTVSQAEAEAGQSTEDRNWTAQRVAQAIAALAAAAVHRHDVTDIDGLQDVLDGLLVSTVFSGAPTTPTPESGDRSLQIANTEYVRQALDELVGAAPGTLDTLKEIADALGDDPNFAATMTQKLAGKSDIGHKHLMADITDLAAALALLAPKSSPAFAGNPTAPTQPHDDNSTKIATTEHVKDAIANSGLSTEGHKHAISDVNGLQDALDGKSNVGHKHSVADITDLSTALDSKANLASPALSGTPTAPTQAVGDSSTRLATTAFVGTALSNGLSGKADLDHSHEIANVEGLQAALDAKAPLSSPTFSGTPKAPTASAGTNTTQIATTAFVAAALAGFKTTWEIADVNGLQTALDEKFSKTGGILSGNVKIATSASQTITMEGAGNKLLMMRDENGLARSLFWSNGLGRTYMRTYAEDGTTYKEISLDSSGAVTVPGTLTVGSTAVVTDTLAIRGTAGEGGQIALGYGGGLATSINGSAANTWNIDVTQSTLRMFRTNSAGTALVTQQTDEGGTTTFSGEVVSTSANSFRISYGGYSAFWRFDPTTMYLLFSDTANGTWNDLRPMSVDRASGQVTLGHNVRVNGNLIVGGTVQAAGGGAYINTDGNVYGSRWATWGSNWAFDSINARIEQRINDAVGYANDRAYWRTQEYLLAEHVPVGGYALLTAANANGVATNLGGGDVYWSSAGGVVTNGNYRVNYGTWQRSGVTTGAGNNNSGVPTAVTLFKRIG